RIGQILSNSSASTAAVAVSGFGRRRLRVRHSDLHRLLSEESQARAREGGEPIDADGSLHGAVQDRQDQVAYSGRALYGLPVALYLFCAEDVTGQHLHCGAHLRAPYYVSDLYFAAGE
ncbi:hypothetical protein FOZ62_020185, partial [Perkinsus olseni]